MNPFEHISRENGLPQSRYCRITEDGFLTIRDHPSVWPYEIPVYKLQSLAQFAEWFAHLSQKAWFTPEVMADFALFCSLLIHDSPAEWRRFATRSTPPHG